MNIQSHLKLAVKCLDMANDMVDAQNFEGARDMLAKAYSHNRQSLEHVHKFAVLKAMEDRPRKETPG